MKAATLMLSCIFLTACTDGPGAAPPIASFPITIPHLASSVNDANGQVEVSITVKSEYREPLKTIRVTLAAYDAQGKRVSPDDEVIEVLGPISRGQSIGPLEKVTSIHDRSVACVEVLLVQAIKLDYTLDSVVDRNARTVVTDSGHAQCRKT